MSVDPELTTALDAPEAIRRRVVEGALAAKPRMPLRWPIAAGVIAVAGLALAFALLQPAPTVLLPTISNAGGGGVRLILPPEGAAPAAMQVYPTRPIPRIVNEAGVVAIVEVTGQSARAPLGGDG